jgi:hypothetical protein
VIAAIPDAQEILTGKHFKFSTAGHPKSKGINMLVSYPASWKAMESDRPNIVQKFVSNDGRGLEMAMIITKSLPLPKGTIIPDEQLKSHFTIDELKKGVPSGYQFISASATTIDNIPGGVLEYSMKQDRAGRTVSGQFITYTFIYGTTLVQFQGAVGSNASASDGSLDNRMAEFKELFFLMANSIVLPDQYK